MQTASKKVINAWAMYDWANSVYNLVITTTFFPIYFLAVTKTGNGDTVRFLGRDFVNSSLYNYTLATAYMIIAFSYPVLTSIADSRGNKKGFMQFFCYTGALGCGSLFFFDKSNLWLGIVAFMLAAMGYVGSLVFYNAYLPELAAPEDRDRISAKGFSYGYIGSVLMQVVGFVLVTVMPDAGFATRLTFLIVGLWWVGFAQITFAALPKSRPAARESGNVFTTAFREFANVWNQVRKMAVLKNYLLSFFFYSMGVQTVMLAATVFGSKVLNLPDAKLIVTIVIIQIVAIAGAALMARLSKTYGNIKVLMGTVAFWIVICVAAYAVAVLAEGGTNAEYYFYGLAVAVGLVMGGIQSLSRSTYSKLMPETTDTASFFSFYDTTEKVAIVIGMFSFARIEEVFGSMKNSVLSLVVFFFAGLIGLFFTLQRQKQSA